MQQSAPPDIVGRVLRASTRGFTCGTHSDNLDHKQTLGAFVEVPVANQKDVYALGLVYSVEIKDDQMINELVMAEAVGSSVLLDQRRNRLIPVEISVLNVGYRDQTRTYSGLPPRPPMTLSDVRLCPPGVVRRFNESFDYFRLVLNASEVPSDDLLAAALRYAGELAFRPDERYDFAVAAGQTMVRLLSNDLKRLSHVLALIRPEA